MTGPTPGPGRRALIPLSPPATLDRDGRPIGEVAALFEDWLKLRQASNRITSAKTIDGYRADMARWATLLAAHGDGPALDRWRIADLDEASIHTALTNMTTAGLSASARQRALAPLRGLCRWLAYTGRLPADPTSADTLTVRSSPPRPPAAFSSNELARIMTVVTHTTGSQRTTLRWPSRELAVLALLAGCGLRASELCALTWRSLGDLDGPQPKVRVPGNHSKLRSVPIGPETVRVLQLYRAERKAIASSGPLAVRAATRVIVRVDGQPLTSSVLTEWVRRWLAAAQVPRRPGALVHAFRVTAADGWLANGATLADVQILLGQASIRTRATYSEPPPEALATVVNSGSMEALLRTTRDSSPAVPVNDTQPVNE